MFPLSSVRQLQTFRPVRRRPGPAERSSGSGAALAAASFKDEQRVWSLFLFHRFHPETRGEVKGRLFVVHQNNVTVSWSERA